MWKRNERLLISSSVESHFDVRLPSGSPIDLLLSIRDQLNTITEIQFSSIFVQTDDEIIDHLLANLQNGSALSDVFIDLLDSGNVNLISQVITSLSSEFNSRSVRHQMLSDGTSLSISPLIDSSNEEVSLVSLILIGLIDVSVRISHWCCR